mmetsp:Transcript_10719/g.43194  ORF Transcript_10719/g.43194 Transcript_10719/m.43194 type:complete len:441 (+) Transcript_10719:694-2016(+)
MRPVSDPPDRRLSSRLRRREPASRPREEDERRDVTLGSLRNLAPANGRGDGPVPVVPVRVTCGPLRSLIRDGGWRLGQRGRGGGGEGLEGTHRPRQLILRQRLHRATVSARLLPPKRDIREREPRGRELEAHVRSRSLRGGARPRPPEHRVDPLFDELDDSPDQAARPYVVRVEELSRYPQAHGVAESRLVDTNRRAQRVDRVASSPHRLQGPRASLERGGDGEFSLRHRQIPDEPPLTGLVVPVRPARTLPRLQHPRTQTLGADVVPEAVAADLRQPLYSTEVNRRVVLAALVHHPDAAFQQRGARLVLAPRALGLGHVEQRLRVVRVRRAEGFGLLLRRARVRVVSASKVAPREFTSPEVVPRRGREWVRRAEVPLQRPRRVFVQPLRLVPSLLQAVELREVVTSGGDVGVVLAESLLRLLERASQVLPRLFVLAPGR